MTKYQIWENDWQCGYDNERGGMLINTDEINDKLYTGDCNWYKITGITAKDEMIDKLNNLIKEAQNNEDFEINSDYDLEEFLKENGIEFDSVDCFGDYTIIEDALCYNMNDNEFFNLNICESETCSTYEWWDGSNWKTEYAGEETTVTEITVLDEVYKNLDEWDGSNWKTGTNFYHEEVYRVLELDGEPVEDMFLLHEWSQWQGDHSTGRVLTKDELEQHIKEP